MARENFYMIPMSEKTYNDETEKFESSSSVLSQEQIAQINEQLKQNLTSSSYNSPLDQIMIHRASPYLADYKGYVDFLFIRTLAPISHPLFMKCSEANAKFKLARYYDFDSVYDETPGMRFNNQFHGDFVERVMANI